MAVPNRSPVYFDRFHLSNQNILFMSFPFRVFNYAEAFQNGRLINIYSYTIRLQNDIQNNGSEFNSFVHKMSHVQK